MFLKLWLTVLESIDHYKKANNLPVIKIQGALVKLRYQNRQETFKRAKTKNRLQTVEDILHMWPHALVQRASLIKVAQE
jgi:hypothetical protein